MSRASRLERLRTNIVLVIVCIVWVLPLVWAIGTALRPPNLPVGTGWLWLPGSPTLENFIDAWNAAPFMMCRHAGMFGVCRVTTSLCAHSSRRSRNSEAPMDSAVSLEMVGS